MVSQLAVLLSACALLRCGVDQPKQDPTAPDSPPPRVAACDSGATSCVAYDFTAGDTCGGCAAPNCVEPGWEVITWMREMPSLVPTLESLDWDCYPEADDSVCYLTHQCAVPA